MLHPLHWRRGGLLQEMLKRLIGYAVHAVHVPLVDRVDQLPDKAHAEKFVLLKLFSGVYCIMMRLQACSNC